VDECQLNVKQTVLTTATDLGAPGVDAVYGWGLVNAGKAVNGPAQFVIDPAYDEDDVDDLDTDVGLWFIADFEGESRPFSNDISGNGGLFKMGGGTLTLTGNNTYAAGTSVNQGALVVTGSLGSDVEVAPGATFITGGNGVHVDGDFDLWNPQEWNVDDVPAAWQRFGAATLGIHLGAPLSVTGSVWIDEGSRLLLLPEAGGYTVNATETLITADQGIIGEFSQAVRAPGFFWEGTISYEDFYGDYNGSEIPHTLIANLTRTSAQARAVSTGAAANVVDGAKMADALIGFTDNLVESGQTTGHETLISAAAKLMSAPTEDAAALALSSLVGNIHGAARALGVQRSFGEAERLANRLRSLTETGMWVNNHNGNGTLSRTGYGDAEVRHSAFGFGTDTNLGTAWTLGLAATRTRSNAHLDVLGGRLTGSGQQMAVYGRRDLGDNGYLTGLVSHDRHTVDTQRRVLTGNSLNSVVGQHTDNATLIRLESGLRLAGGFAPYLAAGNISLRQGGFTESGVLGLSASADTFSARFVDVGSSFERRAGQWRFASTLSIRRMFGSDNNFSAAFTGAQAAGFTLSGQPLARTSVRLGNDVSYRTRNGWRYSLGLGAEHGSGQRGNAWGEATATVGF